MPDHGPVRGLPKVLVQDAADEPQFLLMSLSRTANDGLIH